MEFLGSGFYQIDSNCAPRGHQPKEAIWVSGVFEVHAVQTRSARTDIIAPQLATELIGAQLLQLLGNQGSTVDSSRYAFPASRSAPPRLPATRCSRQRC